MAKKMSKMEPMMSMPMMMEEPPVYTGSVREDVLAAAKQSSSFLNDKTYMYASMNAEMRMMMQDHLKADLIATGNFAIQNDIGGRAVAARIRDEASRIFGEEDVERWF